MNVPVLFVAAALALPQPAAQPSVERTLDRALKAYNAARTTRATFTQVLTNPLTGTTARASGELLMRRPNQVSVTFTDPRGDRIVADGRLLWVYLPSQDPRQVIRLPQGAGGTGGVDVMGQFFDSPRSRFIVTDAGNATIGGRATHALRLVPRAGKGAAFVSGIVWVDDRDGHVRQFEVTDGNGLVRRVTLTKVETNVKVNAKSFTFVMPSGARLVEQPRG